MSEANRQKFDGYFMNGNREKILGNYDEAIKQFESGISIDPSNAALNYNLAECYFEKKKYETAEKYALDAVKLDPKNTWFKELLSDIYLARRKNKESALLMAEIGRENKDVDYLLRSAYLFSMIKDYKNALKVLNEAEKGIGINEEVITRKEQIYLAQNKLDKAIVEIKKLIKAYPSEPKFKGMLADLYWANGKTKEAIAIYLDILKQNPNNGFALFAMADYYKSINQFPEWFDYLKRGMASTDVDSKQKVNVLSSFIVGKEFEDQHNKLKELVFIFANTNTGDPLPNLVMGDVYTQNKNLDSARLEYRKALLIDPSNLTAWQQTIFCSSQLLDNQLLLADCEEAIAYFPLEAAFFAYGAIAAVQLKNYTKAIDLSLAGLNIVTPDQTEMIEQFQSILGDSYHYTKNYQASDSIYEHILSNDSNSALALNNYAYFLSLRKTSLDKAETMSKRSIELDGTNPSYLDTYGWILFVKGDYTKAKEFIEKSLSISPNNAEVLDHLGDVYYFLKDIPSALIYWKKAQELGSENPKLNLKIKEGKWYE